MQRNSLLCLSSRFFDFMVSWIKLSLIEGLLLSLRSGWLFSKPFAFNLLPQRLISRSRMDRLRGPNKPWRPIYVIFSAIGRKIGWIGYPFQSSVLISPPHPQHISLISLLGKGFIPVLKVLLLLRRFLVLMSSYLYSKPLTFSYLTPYNMQNWCKLKCMIFTRVKLFLNFWEL